MLPVMCFCPVQDGVWSVAWSTDVPAGPSVHPIWGPAPVQIGKSVGLPARKLRKMTTSAIVSVPSPFMSPHWSAPPLLQSVAAPGGFATVWRRMSASPILAKPSPLRSPQAAFACADGAQPATPTSAASPATAPFHMLLVVLIWVVLSLVVGRITAPP